MPAGRSAPECADALQERTGAAHHRADLTGRRSALLRRLLHLLALWGALARRVTFGAVVLDAALLPHIARHGRGLDGGCRSEQLLIGLLALRPEA